jgi:toxin FitB
MGKRGFKPAVSKIVSSILLLEEVNKWGEILATAEKNGYPLPAIDSLIAATAQVHDLSVVTRNTKDMEGSGVEVINPWTYVPNK